MLVLEHAGIGPAHVGVRHALQSQRQRLDDEIVDRKLVGRLAVLVLGRRGVDLLARLEQLADVAVDGQVEMRNGLHRRREPLRNGAAHAVVRHEIVAAVVVERADLLVRHRRRDERCAGGRCGRRAQALARFCRLDIAGDDAAVRAGALDAAEFDVGVFRQPPRKRRGKDAVGAADRRHDRWSEPPHPHPLPSGERERAVLAAAAEISPLCWTGADVDGAAACWAAPSPRGGEGGDEGAPALGAFAGALAAAAAAAFGSSPSCAITAMS